MFSRFRVAILIFSFTFSLGAAAQTKGGSKPVSATKLPGESDDSKQGTIEAKVEKYLRNVYAWGPSFEIKIGTIHPSSIPELLEVPITISEGGQSDDAIVYATKDGKFLVRGELDD